MSNETHTTDDIIKLIEIDDTVINLDISVVNQIDVEEWIEASKDIYGVEHREVIIATLEKLNLNNRGFDFIIVKHNNKIIGRAIVDPIENNTHSVNLLGFNIDYEYRGVGIGTILIEYIKVKYKHITLIYTTFSDIMESLGIKTGFNILCNGTDHIVSKPCKWMILKGEK